METTTPVSFAPASDVIVVQTVRARRVVMRVCTYDFMRNNKLRLRLNDVIKRYYVSRAAEWTVSGAGWMRDAVTRGHLGEGCV